MCLFVVILFQCTLFRFNIRLCQYWWGPIYKILSGAPQTSGLVLSSSHLHWGWSTSVWQILLTRNPLSLTLSFHCAYVIVVSVIFESELCGLPVMVIINGIWWTENDTQCIQTSGKAPINTDLIKDTKDVLHCKHCVLRSQVTKCVSTS